MPNNARRTGLPGFRWLPDLYRLVWRATSSVSALQVRHPARRVAFAWLRSGLQQQLPVFRTRRAYATRCHWRSGLLAFIFGLKTPVRFCHAALCGREKDGS
jgi:hypothetical protein